MAKYASLDSLRAIRDWVKEKFQSKLPEVTTQDNGDVLSVVDGAWSKSTPEKELPEVTSADNGKVLAVVAGEWEKAEAPDGLPPVQSADNGKVLTVVEGEWAKADVPDELPAVSASDNGKVLGVVEGQWAKTEPEDGLPEVTSSDNGKVLSVVEGAWAPAEPTGGSGLPEVTSEDNGDLLTVVDGAWAKSEPGYRVENETVIAAEQSVTTESQGPINVGHITATVPDPLPDSVNVTFNGTNYENVPKHADATLGVEAYGDSAFSEYPFVIVLLPGIADLLTQSAGTYTIAITAQITTVTLADDFKLAVNNSYMEPAVTQETFWAAQSITTEAVSGKSYAAADGPVFDYSSPMPEKLNVIFDGTAYELPKIPMQIAYGEETYEGNPDFTTYPLLLQVADNGSYAYLLLRTPQAGTYTIEATYTEVTTAPTEKFKEAVKACGAPGYEAAIKERVVLPTQTLTTAGDEEYPSDPASTGFEFPDFPLAPPEYLIVTVDGTKYELPQHVFDDIVYVYGEFDPETDAYIFTTIPCSVSFLWGPYGYTPAYDCKFLTAEGGDYEVSISVPVGSATPTDAFKNAVHASGAPGYSASSGSVSISDAYFDATQQTIYGKTLFFGEFDFSADILSHATSLKLTVSGSEYTLPRTGSSFGNFGFGAEDFSDGPFFVWCVVGEDNNKTYIAAEESGEYECQVEATLAIIDEVSQDFKAAVNESLEDALNAPFTLKIHITSSGVADRITRGPNNVPTSFLELHGHWDNVSHVRVSKDGGSSFSGKPYYVLDESSSVSLDVLDSLHGSGMGRLTSFHFYAYYLDDSNTASIGTYLLYASSKIEVKGNSTSHRLSQSWSDIWNAVSNGVSPTLVSQDGNTISSALVVSKDAANNLYTVKDMNSGITYTATSENGDPTYTPS